MRKLAFILLIVLTSVLSAHAYEIYTIETLPNPKTATTDNWVCNPDGILSPATEEYINEIGVMLKEQTTAELAVVAIRAFDERQYGDAFTFGVRLFNTWGIGSKDNNAGVLVLLALGGSGEAGGRDIRIITGNGVEGILPDIVCSNIIDDAIDYLADGNYDEGISSIVYDIANRLNDPDAKAELILGFKPKSTEDAMATSWYFIIAVVVFALPYLLAYKKWNPKNKQLDRSETIEETANVQTMSGCLSWIFPIPLLFLYLYLMSKRKKLRDEPYPCPKCKTNMQKLSTTDENIYLTDTEKTEQKIGSRDYDIWLCPRCGEVHKEKYKGKKHGRYSKCEVCGAVASAYLGAVVLESATKSKTGKKRVEYKCAHCGNVKSSIRIIPVIQPTTYSSSSSSSSSWGSSSSSGGSWGGGHSSGGGAGRRF